MKARMAERYARRKLEDVVLPKVVKLRYCNQCQLPLGPESYFSHPACKSELSNEYDETVYA